MTNTRNALDALAEGPRLNLLAAVAVRDVNEAHLIVHGVLARALGGALSSAAFADLEGDLASALVLHARQNALSAALT